MLSTLHVIGQGSHTVDLPSGLVTTSGEGFHPFTPMLNDWLVLPTDVGFELWRPVNGFSCLSNTLASSDSSRSFTIHLYPEEMVPRRSDKILKGLAFFDKTQCLNVAGEDGSIWSYCATSQLFQLMVYHSFSELQTFKRALVFEHAPWDLDANCVLLATERNVYKLDLSQWGHRTEFSFVASFEHEGSMVLAETREALALMWVSPQSFSTWKCKAGKFTFYSRHRSFPVLERQAPNGFRVQDSMFIQDTIVYGITTAIPRALHVRRFKVEREDRSVDPQVTCAILGLGELEPMLFWNMKVSYHELKIRAFRSLR